ncbi:replication protein A 70 kDa DNA-binding subunit B-like [Solanum tuberosum]|uniref:replication protein A 70 kDa DNA-binding subunit B-like n=1 Tax=Solanum tuberosum TaxID=4113 RepID=UPI00073A3F07|nr:PREDICTED: replication protein A 70 kDa DNA-binding subunit B-like [Solanum tuberosum]
MATETELAKQSVPINKIPKNSIESVIRVLVIRRGSITPYKNSRNEGTYRTIILVDEEGTKIQTTLFNKHIETWKDFLKPNKSYYIAKGRYDRVNPNYSSVHKEVELAFTDNTVIKETDHEVSTQKFSDGFLSLDAADNLPNGSVLGNYPNVKVVIFMLHYVSAIANLHEQFPDLICVLVSVNPIIQNATSKRREIVVTNELMEPTTVTLWGDFAENDGAFLDKLKDDKPILGLCDVRVSIYKGRFGISTIPVSSVLINPIFQKALDLRAWREIIEADNKDIIVAPTKAMKRAIEVPLDHILNGLLAESQDSMYKFKATIVDILNKDEPWYLSCKTCRKKVKVIKEAAACTNCNIDNVEYAMRIDLTDANPRRSLIAEEIHQLKDEAPIILEEEVRSVRKYRKRAKKTTNAAAQINQKKPKAAKD